MPLWLWFGAGLLPMLPFLLGAPWLLRFLVERRLERVAPRSAEPSRWPRVSVVVTARDEEDAVGGCLAALGAVDYPDLEIIAVNDRSSDRTGEIIEERAGGNLVAVHLETLPAGWLGKTHAMARGADAATGELIVFTDGDVRFEPEALRLAVRHVEAHRLDHLTLFPTTESAGYWERAFLAFFAMVGLLLARVWAVRRSTRGSFAGVGAFNLVRAQSYRERGGHESLRLEILDDVVLGRWMKSREGRSDALLALGSLRVRWQQGAWGIIRGLEKNAFAAAGYSCLLAAAGTAFYATAITIPWVALVVLRDARAWGFGLGLFLLHGVFGAVAMLFGLGVRVTPGLTGASVLLSVALARSMVVTLRQRGVVWRGTHYSLVDLRRARSDLGRRFRASWGRTPGRSGDGSRP